MLIMVNVAIIVAVSIVGRFLDGRDNAVEDLGECWANGTKWGETSCAEGVGHTAAVNLSITHGSLEDGGWEWSAVDD